MLLLFSGEDIMISFVFGMPYSETASSVLGKTRAAAAGSASFVDTLAKAGAAGQTTALLSSRTQAAGQAKKPLVYDLRPCGYFSLADENGQITYKGVTFQCDRQKNRLTLGDVSNEKACIKVGLKRGGSLVFNRNSKGDLLKALQMFDKEDRDRILAAIYKDEIARSTYNRDRQEQMDSVLGMAPDDDEYTEDAVSGEPEGYLKNDEQLAAEGNVQI